MLVQLPIYFILYRVLRGLTHKVMDPAFNKIDKVFDPGYIQHSSKLYNALHGHTTMKSFGVDLADNASNVLSKHGVASALPYFVLIVLVAGSTYVQQKQINSRNPAAAQANPMGQSMLRIMPVVMGFICLRLPGALVLYMFVSNLYRVGQQQVISHTIYRPARESGLFDKAIEANATESQQPAAPKGFLASLLGDAAPRVGKNADHGFKDGSTNGAKTNGSNGAKTNGSKTNGAKTNGARTNGAKPGGSKPAVTKTTGSRNTARKPASAPEPAPKPVVPPKDQMSRPPGRATPTGSRPNGAARKKKRR
jgi:hypothetical protein